MVLVLVVLLLGGLGGLAVRLGDNLRHHQRAGLVGSLWGQAQVEEAGGQWEG